MREPVFFDTTDQGSSTCILQGCLEAAVRQHLFGAKPGVDASVLIRRRIRTCLLPLDVPERPRWKKMWGIAVESQRLPG